MRPALLCMARVNFFSVKTVCSNVACIYFEDVFLPSCHTHDLHLPGEILYVNRITLKWILFSIALLVYFCKELNFFCKVSFSKYCCQIVICFVQLGRLYVRYLSFAERCHFGPHCILRMCSWFQVLWSPICGNCLSPWWLSVCMKNGHKLQGKFRVFSLESSKQRWTTVPHL